VQLHRWRSVGGREVADVRAALARADVAVDCLLGTGAAGPPREPYRGAIETLTAFAGPVVACDVPSGADAATGQVPDVCVDADLTVTLGAHKLGLWLWPARGRCGRIVVGDIDVDDGADPPRARALEAADVARLLPPPPPDADKRTLGVVTVLAGFAGMTGAATLTARGALAAGAGLVTMATTARDVVAPTVPEATSLALPADDPDAAFERFAEQAERADAIAVGPGVGLASATQVLVRRVVADLDVPVVLDADGLNAFRHEGDALRQHASPLLVATPHRRELARLLAADDADVWPERARLVPERAAAWDAVVVAKGPGSLIVAPDGRAWVNPTGSAALASGGTGDVLTGITAALVAQRPNAEAVAAAVYLHGLAGEEAAARSHPRSVTALDVAAAVPHALRRIEEAR
jgi:ADP-dependent NAD(P)H-hydrate dehydratase / NAD(P)H-hydrate epimerase